MAAWVLLLAVACSNGSPSATPTATPEPPTATAVAEAPTPVPPAVTPTPRPRLGARPFPEAEAENLRRLFVQTAEVRGLEPKGDVEKLIISRRDAAEYLISAIEPEEEAAIRLRQDLYRLVGLIPDDADLLELRISLLRALVLGFYDPDEKALFIVEDIGISSGIGRSTIIHEMVHALQDQHYGINEIYHSLEKDWDAIAAYIHVIEGDARYHELEVVGARHPQTCSAVIPAAPLRTMPAVIQRELESSYTNGLCFVRTVVPQLPNGFDSLFENLPSTIEQVLHPDKYLEGEGAANVELRPVSEVLGRGWREVGGSTLGEFWWWNYLLLGLSNNRQVMDAGAGWGGDRWILYGHDDGSMLVHIGVVWDTEADAVEFWRAFIASLNGREGSSRLSASASEVAWVEDGKHLRATIRGDAVMLIVSDNEDALNRVASVLGLP
jgi:hypothetical protein